MNVYYVQVNIYIYPILILSNPNFLHYIISFLVLCQLMLAQIFEAIFKE